MMGGLQSDQGQLFYEFRLRRSSRRSPGAEDRHHLDRSWFRTELARHSHDRAAIAPSRDLVPMARECAA
jgi:hypothetical protein